MRRIALLSGLLLSAIASAATINATVTPVTTDASIPPQPLPATGPGSLMSHRFELGTCNGAVFGTVLQTKVVLMPAIKATFLNTPPGLLCLRAFASNSFGEGGSYPVSVIGPLPGNAGSIILITVGP